MNCIGLYVTDNVQCKYMNIEADDRLSVAFTFDDSVASTFDDSVASTFWIHTTGSGVPDSTCWMTFLSSASSVCPVSPGGKLSPFIPLPSMKTSSTYRTVHAQIIIKPIQIITSNHKHFAPVLIL